VTYQIAQIQEFFFVVKAPQGQSIPKADPSAVIDIVLQIKRECGIEASGIRFFWPEDDNADMMVAILPIKLT
jgi:hypothetical protein